MSAVTGNIPKAVVNALLRHLSSPSFQRARASIIFSPGGQFLVVTEKAVNSIGVGRVHQDGTLGSVAANPTPARPECFQLSFQQMERCMPSAKFFLVRFELF